MLEPAAMTGSLLHVICHAFIKCTLFLCAGAIIYKTGKTFADPTKNYPIVITYKNTTKGAYIGHHSSVPTDQEVLFSDKVKFELLDKHEKDGILYLTMQERSE